MLRVGQRLRTAAGTPLSSEGWAAGPRLLCRGWTGASTPPLPCGWCRRGSWGVGGLPPYADSAQASRGSRRAGREGPASCVSQLSPGMSPGTCHGPLPPAWSFSLSSETDEDTRVEFYGARELGGSADVRGDVVRTRSGLRCPESRREPRRGVSHGSARGARAAWAHCVLRGTLSARSCLCYGIAVVTDSHAPGPRLSLCTSRPESSVCS